MSKPRKLQASDFSELTRYRFWGRVERKSDDECWPWLGFTSEANYGTMHTATGHLYAHRIAYALVIGSTPDELTLDHTCKNKRCCNPFHLQAVTQSVNIKRYWKDRAEELTLCACGNPRGKKLRRCNDCHNAYHREYRRTHYVKHYRKH